MGNEDDVSCEAERNDSVDSENKLRKISEQNCDDVKNGEGKLEDIEAECSSKNSFLSDSYNMSNSHSEISSCSNDIVNGDDNDIVDISTVQLYKDDSESDEKPCGSASLSKVKDSEAVPMLNSCEKISGQKRYREKVCEEEEEEDDEENKNGLMKLRRRDVWDVDMPESDDERVGESDVERVGESERRLLSEDSSEDDEVGFSLDSIAYSGPSFPFFISASIDILTSDLDDFDNSSDPPDLIREAPVQENQHAHLDILNLVSQRQQGFYEGGQRTQMMFRNQVCGDKELVQRWGLLYKYRQHKGCVNCLDFDETGDWLVSGSDDLTVNVQDWVHKKSILKYQTSHTSNILQTKFLPRCQGRSIITSGIDGQVRLISFDTSTTPSVDKVLVRHARAVHSISLKASNPNELYSCGEDGYTHLIDIRVEKPVVTFKTVHEHRTVRLFSIDSHPFNDFQLCTAGFDPYVRIHDIRFVSKTNHNDIKYSPDMENDSCTACVYNYDGSQVLASYTDSRIHIFDHHGGNGGILRSFTGHMNVKTIKRVTFFGPHSEFVVSGSDTGQVFVWDALTSDRVNVFRADNKIANEVKPHGSLSMLATSGLDDDVRMWMPGCRPVKLEGEKEEKILKSEVSFKDFSFL